MNQLFNDLKAVSRALELILRESIKYQQNVVEKTWNNSSFKSLIEEQSKSCEQKLKNFSQKDLANSMKETFERASMVAYGIKEFTAASISRSASDIKVEKANTVEKDGTKVKEASSFAETSYFTDFSALPQGVSPEDLKATELHHKDKELIEKLEREFEEKMQKDQKKKEAVTTSKVESTKADVLKAAVVADLQENPQKTLPVDSKKRIQQPVAKKYVPKKQELDPEAKQRKVPSSRIGRMISFGSLAAGLGVGTLAEVARRSLGITQPKAENATLDQIFLTEANAERIVNTLCKVRGAALKIGQILSIQDSTVISPVLQKAFERVRQSADFMPAWQVEKVLVNELGSDWRDKLSYFEEKPFAAASIGQVHLVKLKDGRDCAMKIQYPGVAKGIESDINNLVGILKIWNVFPKGLFIDNLVEVAKRELAWEVDYKREAECTKKFKELVKPYPDYIVPEVIDELSTAQIFTSTLIEGMPVDKCVDLEEEHKEQIAILIMQLCLREVFEFRYMQTDPNWSNFFYNPNTRKLSLLDFGATRSYEVSFVKKYIEVIKAAADRDRALVLKISQEMGFLTGYESKTMEDAHVNAVMILAEVFSSEEAFDFGRQDTTSRIQKLVPTIVAERLCPPPEEIYSLHRKLSGVFLLCAKFKVKISCRKMFLQVYENFKKNYP